MKKAFFSSYLIILFCALTGNTQAQYITTIAGSGGAGYSGDGSLATTAQINGQYAVAYDGAGNMFIADASNNVIRMVAAGTGLISTVAGDGTAGFGGDGAAATLAKLNTPVGVAIDGSGNIYIADQINHRIRMLDVSTGIINTVAGTGTAGFSGDGGSPVSAMLNRPFGITLYGGNYYIADRSNDRVRKVNTTTNIISTVAGSGTVGFSGDGGPATTANLNRPEFVAFDAAGNLYIVDNGNNRIRSVDGSGIINTEAGDGSTTYAGDGSSSVATGLNTPVAIAFDASNNYYIADMGNNAVRHINSATGIITTTAGTGTAGYNGECISPVTTAQLTLPSGLVIDPSGDLVISDRGNNRVRKITPPCSDTPAAGTTTASVANGCPYYATLLSLSGAASGCDVSYQWQSSANGVTYTSVSGATSGTYSLSMAFSTYFRAMVTCNTSGITATSSALYLNVNQPPALSPVSGLNNVCIGSSITLSDTATSGSWSASNTTASVSATGLVTGLMPGIDTVMYSATNACGTSVASLAVIINPIVTPALSITANPGSAVCTGTSVNYTAIPVNGGPTPTIQWYVNGTFGGSGIFFTYTPVNGDVIKCIMTTSAPCATVASVTDNDTMAVRSLLTPSVIVSDGFLGDSVCVGTAVTFFGVLTNGGATPTYQWSVNGGYVSTASSYTYTPTNGDVVSLTLNSSLACAAPATATDTALITTDVSETPAISITAYPGDTTCTGYVITYTAHTRYNGTAPALIWKKNGVNVATGFGYTYTPVNGDSVSCTLFSNASCRTIDSAVSNVVHMVVGPHTVSSVTIAAHPGNIILLADSDTLVATAVNTGSGATYQWYVNGSPIAGATSAMYVSDAINDSDSFYCVVNSNNPCSAPAIVTSNGIVIHVITVSGINGVHTNLHSLTLVPNPNNGQFTITGNMNTYDATAAIQVTNLLGSVVYTASVPVVNGKIKKEITLDAALSNGIYILHIMANGENQVARFTVGR